MKELLIMAKSLGGGGSEVALIELINALPEELYNITLVLLDSDNEYAYRLKKKVNIVQLTFNCSFAKSLVSMYAFPAKVLKKLSVNSFIPYYDFISNCVTNVFEKTYDVAIDFYGYGSFVTAFLATKIQANTHEAIIPAEQFELVQRILETETRRPNDAETVALFAGFLYCGDCGSRLVRRSASYKGKRYIYYQCSGSKQNKGSCTSHNLRDEKLYNIVRNALQMQIQIVMEEAEFVESIRQARQEPYRVRRIERQIRQLTAEKAHTQGIKEKLYGDYADEILTREDFLNYNELYSKRIDEYDRKITELEAERQNLQTAPNAYPFLDVYRKYRKLEEITRPMVVELIEKIEVYEGNRVEITFRFHDEIADLLEELHQKQMGQHEVSA